MPYNYDDPVIHNPRKGTSDSPFLDINEPLIIDNSGKVVLTEKPSPFHRVRVTGENEDWYETKSDIPEVNAYRVDYEHKFVIFNIANVGKQLSFKYKGMGNSTIPASSIYTERNGLDIKETLKELTDSTARVRDAAAEAEEKLRNTEYIAPYDSDAEYKKNNIVYYNGTSFMAKKDNKGNPPPNTYTDNDYWGVLSRKGADGTGTVGVHRDRFVAIANQKEFSLSHAYDQYQNRIEVKVDGIPQFSPDHYIESGNKKITFTEALEEGMVVEIKYFAEALPLQDDIQTELNNHSGMLSNLNENKIGNIYEEFFTSTQGQTTFTLANSYKLGKNRLRVYVSGVRQFSPSNYTEVSVNSIQFSEGLKAGLQVRVEIFD